MKTFWDERYAAPDYVYGTEPNAFFRSFIDGRPPGRILLPAEGEGRNAVYAARHGWEVTAFDYSEAGQAKALCLADRFEVKIDYRLADLEHFPFPVAAFDAVGLFFVHVPESIRPSFHQKVINALRPGGWLVLEAFSPEQVHFASGGPRQLELLYTPDQLRDDFSALDILEFQALETDLDEGPFHQGRAAVVRILGRKAP